MRRNSTSTSSTPTGKARAKKKSRKTESFLGDETADETRGPNATLLEAIMNDPLKRAMVMQLINTERDAIEEYKRQELLKGCPSPANKLRRKFAIESPTALLRRRALQEKERSDSGSSCSERTATPSPSPAVPFGRLLEKVVAFVEVRSNNEDRSDGVKALLKNMGATVVEQFGRDVTHVIFKDGSFLTYQKAKLTKKHLVSVLWLETIRTTGRRVPEGSYPALGTSNYDNNVTLICEQLQHEYLEVVRDEMRKSTAVSETTLSSQQNQIALLSQLGNLNTPAPPTSFSEDIIPNSQDMEVRTFTSRSYRLFPPEKSKSPDSLVLQESDVESDCGMVDGRPFKKCKVSMILSDDSETLCDSGGSSEPDKTTAKVDSSMQSKSNDGDALSAPKTIENQTESNDIIVSSEDASLTKKPKKRALYNFKNHTELLNMTVEEERVTTRKSLRLLYNPAGASKKQIEQPIERNTRSSLCNSPKTQVDKKERGVLQPLENLRRTESDLTVKKVDNVSGCTSLESDGGKSLESVGTNVSEELGVFVTRRKPRVTRAGLDKDGFKIPDKKNSPIPTNDSSTENVAKDSRLSTTSTEGQLSSLRISDECKKSVTSVEMSPLILSKPDSFSPLETINNSDSISKLVAHLDSPDVSTKAVRGRRKTRLQGDKQKEFVGRNTRARDDSLPIKPQLNRRSTMDFVPRETPTPKKNVKRRARPSTIVCTRFHRNDVLVFQQIVKKLGGFTVENNVTERTSHLVVQEASRTINILRAIARGIWVLRSEWLYSSLESGKWLPEEDYELINFSPAVQQCRIERETFGSRYSMDIFVNCGPIYVARSTNPAHADLEELIVLGKGTVVNTGRSAAICIGEALRYENVTCVSVAWLLDSVMFNVYKPVDKYVLEKPKPRKSEHF